MSYTSTIFLPVPTAYISLSQVLLSFGFFICQGKLASFDEHCDEEANTVEAGTGGNIECGIVVLGIAELVSVGSKIVCLLQASYGSVSSYWTIAAAS
jgi:hypothetical protein